ncbi:MAG: glycosyltransferase family 2 protein [Candidatus Obscuribacterales bacterium]|nr:glycosyltransferase family 2 protein [Candidatus Obscuribacterales bacterium]
MNLPAFFLVETFLVAVLASLTFLFFHYFRRLKTESLPEKYLPFVSVVVPARNEEGKIERCLESLARQNYPRYEVIAIDDRSDDRTGEIIRGIARKYPHVKYVAGTNAPPPGWVGKCNALVQAVDHVKGEWLLFTDADTCHTPESLRYALSYSVKNKAELISFMPVQELGSFWERVVMPVLLGSFLCGDPLNTINEHTNERAYAYGQYILVRRDVYEAVGGHYSVFDQILEDISLARAVKAKGYHILSADGQLLYKVRMYTDLQSLWNGWTKNLYALIECRVLFLVLVLGLVNTAIFMPFVSAGIVAARMLHGDFSEQTCLLSGLVVCQLALLLAWYLRTAQHYEGVSLKHFFLLPLGSVTMSLLYLHSAYLVLSGKKVNWKGRRYVVNTSKSIESESIRKPKSTTEKVERTPVETR